MRTAAFALRIIKLYSVLQKSTVGQVIGKQILRSGTSVGAHVAEVNHSKSAADFINKVAGARQEVQETLYWLYLIEQADLVVAKRLLPLRQEAVEIKAILVTMATRAKRRADAA
ncbi:four helix bundle protein [candidate division KSB1 bacterium]|nr:four helix bundle protein [candidate division KSB1 bacterium]